MALAVVPHRLTPPAAPTVCPVPVLHNRYPPLRQMCPCTIPSTPCGPLLWVVFTTLTLVSPDLIVGHTLVFSCVLLPSVVSTTTSTTSPHYQALHDAAILASPPPPDALTPRARVRLPADRVFHLQWFILFQLTLASLDGDQLHYAVQVCTLYRCSCSCCGGIFVAGVPISLFHTITWCALCTPALPQYCEKGLQLIDDFRDEVDHAASKIALRVFGSLRLELLPLEALAAAQHPDHPLKSLRKLTTTTSNSTSSTHLASPPQSEYVGAT